MFTSDMSALSTLVHDLPLHPNIHREILTDLELLPQFGPDVECSVRHLKQQLQLESVRGPELCLALGVRGNNDRYARWGCVQVLKCHTPPSFKRSALFVWEYLPVRTCKEFHQLAVGSPVCVSPVLINLPTVIIAQ